jgi:hypothetical protein
MWTVNVNSNGVTVHLQKMMQFYCTNSLAVAETVKF